MTSENQGATGEEERRAAARTLVGEAEAARREGDDEEAERLLDDARRIDPQATEDAIAASPDGQSAVAADTADSDEEVHRITATVEPGSDAPSRAGITGSGSGADGM